MYIYCCNVFMMYKYSSINKYINTELWTLVPLNKDVGPSSSWYGCRLWLFRTESMVLGLRLVLGFDPASALDTPRFLNPE